MQEPTEEPEAREIRIGIVTVSDRASQGVYEDRGGPAILEEYSGTTLVPMGCTARVRRGGHLWIERG